MLGEDSFRFEEVSGRRVAQGRLVLDAGDYANWINEGLRVARKQAAPQLIRVPLPQPQSGGQS